TKERDDAIAQALKDITVVMLDARCARIFVGVDDRLNQFRVEPARQLGEPDKIAKENRQLTAFGAAAFPVVKRFQNEFARADRKAEFAQIFIRQDLERFEIHFIRDEQWNILLEIERVQPIRNRW